MKTTEYYWGCCPDCEPVDMERDGTPWPYLNIGKGHWFYCDEHRTCWFVGSNLFSTWQWETLDEQRDHYERKGFGMYRHLEPSQPAPNAVDLATVGMTEDRERTLELQYMGGGYMAVCAEFTPADPSKFDERLAAEPDVAWPGVPFLQGDENTTTDDVFDFVMDVHNKVGGA